MSETRAKYNARPVTIDGYRFDSTAEYRRFQALILMQQAGEILDLKVHPRFEILRGFMRDGVKYRPTFYEADFQYVDCSDDEIIVEDVKGARTPLYLLKRKMFLSQYYGLAFKEIDA